MLKRFISYYKPHKKLLIMDMIAALLISVTGMAYPIITRTMLNDYIPNKMYQAIIISGIIVLALYIIRMFLNYFVQCYGHIIGVKMQSQMRQDLFAHLQKLPYKFYDNNETGRIMTRITSDLFEVCELAHHGPENLLISSIMIILSFSYLMTINWILTLIVFACVPILIIVTVVLRKAMKNAFDDRRKSNATINASVESSVTGIRVTKAYTNSAKEIEKFKKGDEEFVDSSHRAYSAMAKFFASTSFVTDVFNVIILIAGGMFLYAGQISFGDYSTFIISVNLFIRPVNTLISFMEQFQNGVSGFKRFVEIMEEEPETDREGAIELTNVNGEIEFKNVTYSYDTTKEVLHNVDLKLSKGCKLALVGPSGGGKTTLCHLLPNFYKLDGEDSGAILIDGVDIRDITLDSLRKNIGIVQQDVFLFVGTIKENIIYGKPDATDEEIVEAAKKANIHDFIMSLPDGYNTLCGERGIKLSGGQKQRLAIARAMLKKSSVILFDESTSSLDNLAQNQVKESINNIKGKSTIVIVAHRLSTIKNVDKIFFLEKGKITDEGTFEELFERNENFRKIFLAENI